MGRSGPRCAPPCPPDRPVTSLMLPDPKPALTLPSLARSPDLAAEPQAPFGTTAARYFAAHRPHPRAQPACRTSTHSKTSLVGRSQLLSLMLRHFLRAHFSRVSGQGGGSSRWRCRPPSSACSPPVCLTHAPAAPSSSQIPSLPHVCRVVPPDTNRLALEYLPLSCSPLPLGRRP